MARADIEGETREDSSGPRVLSTSASFRSAASYASFRSCNSFKSTDGQSRASFKSVASRGTSYYSVASRFLGRSVSDGGPPGDGLEGVDNLSFFSFEGTDSALPSLSGEGRGAVPPPPPPPLPPGAARQRLGDTEAELETGKVTVDTTDPALCEKESAGHRAYLGIFLLALAAGLHTAVSSVTPFLSPGIDPWFLLLARSGAQLALSLPLLCVFRASPAGPHGYRWRLYLLALLSAALVLALHLALTRLPAPLAGTLLSLAPALTALLALPVAREHTGLFRILILGLYTAGVLLQARPGVLFPGEGEGAETVTHTATPALTQYNILGLPLTFLPPLPPASPSDPLGLTAGILAPLVAGVLLLVCQQCRREGGVRTVLLIHWTSLGLTLVSVIGLFTQAEVEDPIGAIQLLSASDWLLVALVVTLGCLATALITLALAWVAPGKAALVVSSTILFSYALELALGLVTADPVDTAWPSLAGAACLLVALLCTGMEGVMVDTARWRWL